MRYLFYVAVGWMCAEFAQADMTAEIGLTRADTDYNRDVTAVTANYFFSPVDTSVGPLAVATFFQRADQVGISYSDERYGETVVLNGLYSHNNSGWFISGEVGRSTAGYSRGVNVATLGNQVDFDRDLFKVSVGKYIFKSTTVALGFSQDSSDSHNQSTFTFAGAPPTLTTSIDWKFTLDIEEVNLEIRHFGMLGESAYELKGVYALVDRDSVARTSVDGGPVSISRSNPDFSRFGLSAKLFPVNSLSVGAFFSREGSAPEFESTGIKVEWFPVQALAVSVSYARSDFQNTPILPTAGTATAVSVMIPSTFHILSGVLRTSLATGTSFTSSPVRVVDPVAPSSLYGPDVSVDTLTLGVVVRF